MNRRKFFGALFGLVAVPSIIVKALSAGPIEITLHSVPITSKVRKLKATWSNQAEQNLYMMSSEMQREIDREILKSMERAA